ncbi:MAG: DUF1885 family protein [Gorillibacterium sp.]|nr:DUF1885 family protein [Gorillibacterium sp.]
MSQSAYIELVEGSAVSSLTLDELSQLLQDYQQQLAKTGSQLAWNYAEIAFPYTIETKPEADGQWFYLKGKNSLYRSIVMGIRSRMEDGQEFPYIQIVLPDGATHGDKGKANELCKHLGRRLQARLRMFNGRVMYFNTRK